MDDHSLKESRELIDLLNLKVTRDKRISDVIINTKSRLFCYNTRHAYVEFIYLDHEKFDNAFIFWKDLHDLLKERGYISKMDISKIVYPLVYKQNSYCVICGRPSLSGKDLINSIFRLPRHHIDFIMEHPETLEDKIICCKCYSDLASMGGVYY